MSSTGRARTPLKRSRPCGTTLKSSSSLASRPSTTDRPPAFPDVLPWAIVGVKDSTLSGRALVGGSGHARFWRWATRGASGSARCPRSWTLRGEVREEDVHNVDQGEGCNQIGNA